eukprot:scaffold1803_cov150-Skeletonema_marinoi.AAC.22
MGEKAEVVTAARDARRVTNFILYYGDIFLMTNDERVAKSKNPSQVEVERQKEDGHLKMLRQIINRESLTGTQCAICHLLA